MKRAARGSFGSDGSIVTSIEGRPPLKFSHPIKAERRGNSNPVCRRRAWLQPAHRSAKSHFFLALSRAAAARWLVWKPAGPRWTHRLWRLRAKVAKRYWRN